MWTCRKCRVELKFSQVSPEIDFDGFYFDCPSCEQRNRLINMGQPGGHLLLAQEEIDWSKQPFGK